MKSEFAERSEQYRKRHAALREAIQYDRAFRALNRFVAAITLVGQLAYGWRVPLTGGRTARMVVVAGVVLILLQHFRNWWQAGIMDAIKKAFPIPGDEDEEVSGESD